MTVQEVEAKRAQLEVELSTALEAAKILVPATVEFDEAYGRYLSSKTALAKIPEEIAKAKLLENAEDIAAAGLVISEAITELVNGLKVADLLGVPVTTLRYFVSIEGIAGVVFNPTVKLPAPKGTGKAKGAGHTQIVDVDGNRISLTKFVLAHATEEDKTSRQNAEGTWYPHTMVDSKPKFEAFCAGHGLSGFVYETPGTAPSEPAS